MILSATAETDSADPCSLFRLGEKQNTHVNYFGYKQQPTFP